MSQKMIKVTDECHQVLLKEKGMLMQQGLNKSFSDLILIALEKKDDQK